MLEKLLKELGWKYPDGYQPRITICDESIGEKGETDA